MILGNAIKKKRQGYIKYEEQSKKCIKYEVKVYKVCYIRNGTNYEQESYIHIQEPKGSVMLAENRSIAG